MDGSNICRFAHVGHFHVFAVFVSVSKQPLTRNRSYTFHMRKYAWPLTHLSMVKFAISDTVPARKRAGLNAMNHSVAALWTFKWSSSGQHKVYIFTLELPTYPRDKIDHDTCVCRKTCRANRLQYLKKSHKESCYCWHIPDLFILFENKQNIYYKKKILKLMYDGFELYF